MAVWRRSSPLRNVSATECVQESGFTERRRRVAGSTSAIITASAIGGAISQIDTVSESLSAPTRIPMAKVAASPSEVRAIIAIRCAPSSASSGIAKSPVTEPSEGTTTSPRRTGVEKSQSSTIEPGSKPFALMRTASPGFSRTFPSLSSVAASPLLSTAANVALMGPT